MSITAILKSRSGWQFRYPDPKGNPDPDIQKAIQIRISRRQSRSGMQIGWNPKETRTQYIGLFFKRDLNRTAPPIVCLQTNLVLVPWAVWRPVSSESSQQNVSSTVSLCSPSTKTLPIASPYSPTDQHFQHVSRNFTRRNNCSTIICSDLSFDMG